MIVWFLLQLQWFCIEWSWPISSPDFESVAFFFQIVVTVCRANNIEVISIYYLNTYWIENYLLLLFKYFVGYRLPYARILGGIAAIRSDLFIKVNGYSNKFFGWGGEDDDFSARCRRKGIDIVRYPQSIARYQMIKHKHDKGNEKNPARFVTLIKFYYPKFMNLPTIFPSLIFIIYVYLVCNHLQSI